MPDNVPTDDGFVLVFNETVYKYLKFLALVLLPAFAVLYLAVSLIWGLPYPQRVALTVTAVDTFLGTILGISSKSYANSSAAHDGDMVVEETEDNGLVYHLNLNGNPESLADKKTVSFKVKR